METDLKVRQFEFKRDAAMVNAWARAHGRDRLPVEYLPPDGVIVERAGEPVAAGWLYKSLGVGVAFLEHLHAAPGQTLKESRDALDFIVRFFQFEAREDDYGVILTHTTQAMAREAERTGWQRMAEERVCMALPTGLAERRVA